MIVHDNPLITLSANANPPTQCFWLAKGRHKVDIIYGVGVTGTVTMVQTMSPGNTNSLDPVEEEGIPYSTTKTDSRIVEGPGYYAFPVSSLAGGSITVRATRNA